jgi:exodeoxyribonuclease VII large subunit
VKFFSVENNQIKITGQTFFEKEFIKSLNGRWVSNLKWWTVPYSQDRLEQLILRGFIPAIAKPSETTLPKTPGHSDSSDLTVGRLLDKVSGIIESQFSTSVFITGEVSSFKMGNQHAFFELSDPPDSEEFEFGKKRRTKSVNAIIWASQFQKILKQYPGFVLQEGIQIRAKVYPEFSVIGGKLQLIVEDIDPAFTLGQLALSRELIIKTLKERGLYHLNRKLQLTSFPLRIALITADKSRAMTDFIDELSRYKIAFIVVIFDCNMQGENTEPNITAAMNDIDSLYRGQFDCIVITRGGGSRLDLRWFDALDLAKSICHANIPVITAIGHHDDQSICDEVAFQHVKTPTAAAVFLAETVLMSLQRISFKVTRICEKANLKINNEKKQLEAYLPRISNAAKSRLKRETLRLKESQRTLLILKKTIINQIEQGITTINKLNGQKLELEEVQANLYHSTERPKVIISLINKESLQVHRFLATITEEIK